MTSPSHPRYSLLALAIAQAFVFASSAHAQTADNVLPAVTVVSGMATSAGIAGVGSFSDTPLREVPASISVITHEQMQDRSIRSATDAVKYDASVQNSYNAVGLSDRLAIRGYEIDYGSSYRKDGLVILGHSSIPLENKEKLEILKGLAGLQAGIAASGGILNYVTKRPTNEPLRTVTLEASERGTMYGAVDLGGRSDDKRFGYRINAAAADIKSYAKGSNGDREFVSGAFDWRLSPKALLQIDFDYQHKSQLSVPGFQLLGGTALPPGVSAKTMLNNQPWSQPVTDDTNNIGVKFEYELNDNWRTTLQANKFTLRRDDAVALPYDFKADGAYTVVDLRRDNDKRSVMTTQALLQGKFATGFIKHELTLGAATLNRRDNFAEYLFAFKGQSNIYNPIPVPNALGPTNPVSLRRKDEERSFFTQDIVGLTDRLKLHAGLRYTQFERDQLNSPVGSIPRTEKSFVLPNVALVFSPQENLSVYGSYSEGLEPGGEAPADASNKGIALDPAKSKQFEVGVKADISNNLSATAALFQIKRPYEYMNASNLYVAVGDEIHRGLELSAQGRATRNLTVGASLTTILAEASGDSRLDNKRIGNVPKYKSAVYMDYTMPQLPALKLNATWIYSSSKLFAPNGNSLKRVDGYHVLNVGTQYKTKVSSVPTTIRFGINNLFDKFYWADTANAFGGYVIPGAPRVFKLSAQFDF